MTTKVSDDGLRWITTLFSESQKGPEVSIEPEYHLEVEKDIAGDHCMGSSGITMLTAGHDIHIRAPGCIAGKTVQLIAAHTIHLGVMGQGVSLHPVRICAIDCIKITAKALRIGPDIVLYTTPKKGSLSCEDLTFIRPATISSEWLGIVEIIKKWAAPGNTMQVHFEALSGGSQPLSPVELDTMRAVRNWASHMQASEVNLQQLSKGESASSDSPRDWVEVDNSQPSPNGGSESSDSPVGWCSITPLRRLPNGTFAFSEPSIGQGEV